MAGVPYSVSTSQVRKDEILQHSHGRAPWYDMQGVPSNAYVIGIAGGSASGKVCIVPSQTHQSISLNADSANDCTLTDIRCRSHFEKPEQYSNRSGLVTSAEATSTITLEE